MLSIFSIANQRPLEFLLKGLNQVHYEYMQISYDHVERGHQRPEASFVAELYHQLRILQKKSPFVELKLHVDLTKQQLGINSPTDKCLGNFNPNRLRPDLVLHGGQNDNDSQILISEVKMDGATEGSILNDLQKLIFYKVSRLKFKNAVFIFSGTKEQLEGILVNLCSNQFSECLKEHKILFACKNKQWQIFNIQEL